jgi:hypothetical protein
MCWEWLEQGRIQEEIEEETRLLETESEPLEAEPEVAEEEQELIPA